MSFKGTEHADNTEQKEYDPLKVFIGNLSYDATEEDISSLFQEFGVKNVRILTDRETGRSKGFGFAEFETAEGSSQAKELDGTEFQGRKIKITAAEKRDPNKKPSHSSRGSYGGGERKYRSNDGYGNRDGFSGKRGERKSY